ncbi:MAG: flagellar protein FlgN [Lachnospiraceae bacterium]|nr:flagellar protein FlgN [Lachnospiraceae bacterium]
MASLVEELINVLKKEEEVYQTFLEVSQEKTKIVIAGDIKALEELTEIEHSVSDALLVLGNKQIRILQDIKNVLGRQDGEMTVTRLIGYLSSQPKVQQELTTAREKLLETAKKAQLLNRQNEILLQQAIELTEFDITLFKSMRQAPETANYNRSAQNTGTLLGSSGFDAKQ